MMAYRVSVWTGLAVVGRFAGEFGLFGNGENGIIRTGRVTPI